MMLSRHLVVICIFHLELEQVQQLELLEGQLRLMFVQEMVVRLPVTHTAAVKVCIFFVILLYLYMGITCNAWE